MNAQQNNNLTACGHNQGVWGAKPFPFPLEIKAIYKQTKIAQTKKQINRLNFRSPLLYHILSISFRN